MKCPVSDLSVKKPSEVFEVPCPKCGADVEFFGDDRKGTCPKCGHRFRNPRLDQ